MGHRIPFFLNPSCAHESPVGILPSDSTAHWHRQPLSFRRCDARGRFSRSRHGVGEVGGSSKAASRAGEGDASSEVRHGHKRRVTTDPKKGLFELPRHVLLAIDFIQDVLLIEILDWFIRDPLVLGLSDHINRKHAVSQIISIPQFALRYGQWHSFVSLQVHSQIKISDWLYMFLTGNCPRDVLLLCSLHCQNFCRLFFNAL